MVVLGGWLMMLTGVSCSSEGDDPDPTVTLRDTTGAVFEWVCTGEGCTVEAVDGSPPLPTCADGLTPEFRVNAGRFFMVGGRCILEDGSDELVDERIVACDEGAACPSDAQGGEYECRSGLCQSADLAAHPAEAVPTYGEIFRLCRAQSDWYSALEPGLFDRIDAVCPEGADGPCDEVPADCMQP